MISTGSYMGGGITIRAYGGDSVRLATGVTATQHWEGNSAGNWITGEAGLDIGSTTDAEQPRDVHINRALNVGNVTAVTGEGDLRAGSSQGVMHYQPSTSTLFLDNPGTLVDNTITTGPTNNFGRSLYIRTKDEPLSNAGQLYLIGGNAGSTNGNGGSVVLSSGTGQGPGGAGNISLTAQGGGALGDGEIIFRTATGGVAERWKIDGTGHFLAGAATSYDIGSTTDADQPRDLHLNRALNVGDVTASTSEGHIVAGNTTNLMSWDATNGRMFIGDEIFFPLAWIGKGDLRGTNGVHTTSAGGQYRLAGNGQLTLQRWTASGGPYGQQDFINIFAATDGVNSVEGNEPQMVWQVSNNSGIGATLGYDSYLTRSGINGAVYADRRIRIFRSGTETELLRLGNSQTATGTARVEIPGHGLIVGDVTGTAPGDGDIVAGDGANSLQWDASAASVTITGSGNNSVSLDADSGSAVTTVRDIAGNLLHTGLSINAYNSSGVGGVGLGGQIIFSAENDGSVTSSALEQQGYMRMFWRDASESSGAPFQAPYAQWELWMKRGVVSGAGGEKLALVLGNTTTATGDMRAEFWSNAGDRTVTINADQESIQIGQNASAPGAAGDIVAGDGTNELHYSGADGSLNLGVANGASQTFDTATAVVDFSVSGTATGLIPAGAMVVGVTTYVFGTAISGGGATGYEVGDGTDVDRWGSIVGLAIGTDSDPRDFTDNTLSFNTGLSAADVVLTGIGGTPTAGTVRVVVTYMSLTAPTS
jgi:hypothetical protein